MALSFVPLPGALVERIYSRTLFPVIQRLMTGASNLIPIALFDVLLGAVIVWLVGSTVVDVARRKTWLAAVGRVARRVLTTAALLYLAFAVIWGLNYRRLRLEDKVVFDAGATVPPAAKALALEAVRQVNALHDDAHRGTWAPIDTIDPVLARTFADAVRALGVTARVELARPKATQLELYFRRAAVDGMTDPYFLETLVNTQLLAFERPMTVAHEWSHLAGFADEGEANFVGWLACVRGPAPLQYSAWLFLYAETLRVLSPRDRADVGARLQRGPRADLQAIVNRVRQHVSPRVSRIGERVYDRYLKAQGVSAGTSSYAGVVRLVLGTGVGSGVAGRTPVMRESWR